MKYCIQGPSADGSDDDDVPDRCGCPSDDENGGGSDGSSTNSGDAGNRQGSIPRFQGGSATVDLSTGGVLFQLSPPRSGALDPIPVFTFNSRYTTITENGRGVVGSYNAKITEVDASTVKMITAKGGSRVSMLYNANFRRVWKQT